MTATIPDDPYDTGRDWQCDEFAAEWQVEVDRLRRALNSAAFSLTLSIGRATAKDRRAELHRIAKAASELAKSVTAASDDTIFFFLSGSVPRHFRSDITIHPSRYGQKLAKDIQTLADRAQKQAEMLIVTKKPKTGAATVEERTIVGNLAMIWWNAHRSWPRVSNRKAGERDGKWTANEGGRFIMAAASQFFSLKLSDQRLRTTLDTIQSPAT